VLLVGLLVGALVSALAIAGPIPGAALARAISERILCAASLGGACGGSPLEDAYGPDVATLIERHAPLVRYEAGMRALPVDYRRCREDACAEGAESGSIWRSRVGEPVVAFTRVVDCRAGAGEGPGGEDGGADCSGRRAGNLYLQYWFYYPGSATGGGDIPIVKSLVRAAGKAVPPVPASRHEDDWKGR
jgi:hypothetical protein